MTMIERDGDRFIFSYFCRMRENATHACVPVVENRSCQLIS